MFGGDVWDVNVKVLHFRTSERLRGFMFDVV